ncbi:TPA: hypothetical protein PCO36_004753 [Klebsiella oxytoca]|nr:hypothetical protein [Klebsiella oxytoca]
MDPVAADRGLRINSTVAVIQAVITARGVALACRALLAQEIESGRIVHLLPGLRWPVTWADYAVASPGTLKRYEVSAFHDWLVEKANTQQNVSESVCRIRLPD